MKISLLPPTTHASSNPYRDEVRAFIIKRHSIAAERFKKFYEAALFSNEWMRIKETSGKEPSPGVNYV